jgi:hypothetical protein
VRSLGSHDDGNEDGWAEALQQDIGGRFEDRIRHEEERERSIVLAGANIIQTLLQPIDLGIANVGTIEKGEKVEDTELCLSAGGASAVRHARWGGNERPASHGKVAG